jgi:HEAT repeat protein
LFVAMLGASLAITPAPARAEVPQIEDVEESLVRDPSYKVRVDAALILAKLRQQRSLPALIAGTKDGHPAVRAASVRALGLTGGPGAREAVVPALHDPTHTVRHMAREALRNLGGIDESTPAAPGQPTIRRRPGRQLSFEIRPVGDPRNQADPVLRSHMRDFLVQRLRPLGDVAPQEGQATYAVGGVIKALTVARDGQDVEVTCAVELVVMRQPGNALFLMTSGQGRVQKPRRQFRPQLQASMELEAVEVAVRGASEDLISQLPR